jgi:hypothetical protein
MEKLIITFFHEDFCKRIANVIKSKYGNLKSIK